MPLFEASMAVAVEHASALVDVDRSRMEVTLQQALAQHDVNYYLCPVCAAVCAAFCAGGATRKAVAAPHGEIDTW